MPARIGRRLTLAGRGGFADAPDADENPRAFPSRGLCVHLVRVERGTRAAGVRDGGAVRRGGTGNAAPRAGSAPYNDA